MSYKLEYPYTEQERLDFIVKYNHVMGLRIETIDNFIEEKITEDILDEQDILDEEGNIIGSEIVVVDTIIRDEMVNYQTYYALEANEIMIDNIPQLDPEFGNKQLEFKRQEKLQELTNALTDKQNNVLSTLTFNIPVTLKKSDEHKYVESFKLLTVTSAGSLTNVLMGYTLVASSADIADIIVTADGYTIVGLNELVENTKLINLIFAECTKITANMTIYFRNVKDNILNAVSIDELDDIIIDFTQF